MILLHGQFQYQKIFITMIAGHIAIDHSLQVINNITLW
jgi:hypothetical protein